MEFENSDVGEAESKMVHEQEEVKEEWFDISPAEEDLIERLHKLLGDRWSLIAGRLPNRNTEEVERYWKMKEKRRKQKEAENKLCKPKSVRVSPSFQIAMVSSIQGEEQ